MYQSDFPLFGNHSADDSKVSMNKEFSVNETADMAIQENENAQSWHDVDPAILELGPVYESSDSELKLYQDAEYKQLFAVKGDQAKLIYESKEGNVYYSDLSSFPSSPSEAFVVFYEKLKGDDGLENKGILHIVKLDEDATVAEVTGLPQPGFQSGHELKWSPSNSYPILVVENTNEWVVGVVGP